MNETLKPIKCKTCGKFFICQGRFNIFHNLQPLPRSKEFCKQNSCCDCENCNQANKESKVCKNISFNPSRRDASSYLFGKVEED